MYLKLMSGETISDGDIRKRFTMIDNIARVDFEREPKGEGKTQPQVHVRYNSGEHETFPLVGNAYLLNEQGQTIGRFTPTDIS